MDVDQVEEPQTQEASAPQKRMALPVDDAHPFDLEGYISNYSGNVTDTWSILLLTRNNRKDRD